MICFNITITYSDRTSEYFTNILCGKYFDIIRLQDKIHNEEIKSAEEQRRLVKLIFGLKNFL